MLSDEDRIKYKQRMDMRNTLRHMLANPDTQAIDAELWKDIMRTALAYLDAEWWANQQ